MRLCCIALFAAAFLLVAPLRLNAQNANGPVPPNSMRSLAEVEQTLTLLEGRLIERQREVESLKASLLTADERLSDFQASLILLQNQLRLAQESLIQSQADLMATSSSLEQLSKDYEALDSAWKEYRKEMATQLADLGREARLAKGFAMGFGISTVLLLALSLFMILK